MKNNLYFILYFFLILPVAGISQSLEIENIINWKGIIKDRVAENTFLEYMYFENAVIDPATSLPLYLEKIPLDFKNVELSAEIISTVFKSCNTEEISFLNRNEYNKEGIEINTSIAIERKSHYGIISFTPIRLNTSTGQFEKLVSFKIKINIIKLSEGSFKSTLRQYAEHSVLASGDWYKIKVEKSGIYKITYNDLIIYGIEPSSVDPKNIRIYGNGTGMLPESNKTFRYDDLQENAIYVKGEEDGTFDEDDYILFFGNSPHIWNLVLGFFNYNVNLYDNHNYYFLTASLGPGKRLESQPSSTSNPSHIITKYNNYTAKEDENINLIKSGKEWYGDEFGEINTRQYEFEFPEIITAENVIIKIEVANRTFVNEKMVIRINDDHSDTVILTSVGITSTMYARKKKKTIHYNATGSNIQVELEYLPASEVSRAWLNYIKVNATCNLKLTEGQLLFRDLTSINEGSVTKFIVSNTNEYTQIWEVTDNINPNIVESQFNEGDLFFTLNTDSLREFVAFDGTMFYSPEFIEIVENQDLHGSGPFDMVIVTHSLFVESAQRLKQLHETKDGMTILITSPNEIYNEFSSGSQDPTAIRDMMKMFYDKFEGQETRFLMLIGDGSYDPKDRLEDNTNFIPAFQTQESLKATESFVIDDYFGYLDDNEGNDGIGTLDIGIGRLPVQTSEEAMEVVDKIDRYITKGEPQFGNWRSKICIIADDEDGNLHLEQADSLAGMLPRLYNLNKIYLDAYQQVSTPSGHKYPDVSAAINKQMEEGALIINYIGHGGKGGWAHERILQISDINNWINPDKLPVFIAATCQFSRFDEPELKTGGELVLLNPNGGGIALFTTTRLAYATANFTLNRLIYEHAFDRSDGEYPYMGDIIRLSKPPGMLTTRNFVLLGDPALKMAYPEFEINTLQINGIDTELELTDTLQALTEITVKGMIADNNGQKVTDFNGILRPVVYDKAATYKTFGNDGNSFPVEFHCQNKIIWQGKASVTNGDFLFSFMVPKDIAYNYGSGKISYYAFSDESDAEGYFDEIIIGGFNENAETDTEGPEIKLYLNDEKFVSGDQTNKDPVMLAYLNDIHGINLSGNGIGHDMVAVLDQDYNNTIFLNDFFEPDIDTYQSGKITYPFYNLCDGRHTLTLKAWDVYNNPSEVTIEFVININASLSLNNVMNFPNPFKDKTTFTFDHTRPGDELDIDFEIFDLTGKSVLKYSSSIITSGISTHFLDWDGTDATGNKLKNGMYIYTLTVKDENDVVSKQTQKLVLMN